MFRQSCVLVLGSLVLLTGCSKIEELDQRTETMTETTSEMADITSHMYPQIRTKESEDTRNKKMQIILSEESAMGAKVAASAIYFQSFEFQFWNNNKTYDTLAVRERLFLDAANEFYRRAGDIYQHIDTRELSPMMGDPKEYNQEMAFMSLSLAMHMINHHQEHIYAKTGKSFEMVSFYDLLKKALLKEKNKESMSEAEEVFVTGKNKEISYELLKARYNMLVGAALSSIVDSKEVYDLSFLDQGSAAWAKFTNGKGGKIKLTSLFEKSNEATQKEVIKILDAALKTKELLKTLEGESSLHPMMNNILTNLKIMDANEMKLNPDQLQKSTQFKELVKSILK